jgi:hypothetical protein
MTIEVEFQLHVTNFDTLISAEKYNVSIDFASVLPTISSRIVVAAQAVGGHRAVNVSGLYTQPDTQDLLLGISSNAADSGGLITIVRSGSMKEPSWNWIPNAAIFITTDGVLTQTMPSGAPLRRIAWAVSATEINVDFFPIINQ